MEGILRKCFLSGFLLDFFSWRGSSGSIKTKTTVVHLNDETKASQMCQGLNSHYFHIIGDGHQPNSRGLYTHYKDSRIPIKGGMTIPNIATFDHGTNESVH